MGRIGNQWSHAQTFEVCRGSDRSISTIGVRGGPPLTYEDVGGSLRGVGPAGFRHDRYDRILGQGQDVFDYAKEGLEAWRAHHSYGVNVFPSGAGVAPGSVIIVMVGVGVALAHRVGLSRSSTSPGGGGSRTERFQAIRNKEAFVLNWADDDRVHFEIDPFSRLADRLVRLACPIARQVQRFGTSGYLTALHKHVIRRYPSRAYP
jgi:uncharacterized protein (UPF0548 family)